MVLFYFNWHLLSNYADQSNLHNIGKDRESAPKKKFRALTEWFFENYMVLKQKKCYYMCIVRNTENDKFEFDNLFLETAKKKLTYNKLTFDSRIKSICRKTSQKLGELLKITNCLNSNKKKAYI